MTRGDLERRRALYAALQRLLSLRECAQIRKKLVLVEYSVHQYHCLIQECQIDYYRSIGFYLKLLGRNCAVDNRRLYHCE